MFTIADGKKIRAVFIKSNLAVHGRECIVYTGDSAQFLLIQPVDQHDLEVLDTEIQHIEALSAVPFTLAAFRVIDWNQDLSPWEAPPVFGKDGFGNGAANTLKLIQTSLLPELKKTYALRGNIPVILGGYSLAGFFALWSAYQTDAFSAVACASPSVWFPGWIEYAETRAPRCETVYLSLGDREEKARNPVMARVGECIRRQDDLLAQTVPAENHTLEWTAGNHFQEPDLRTAKAFAWCIKALNGHKQ